MNIVQERRQTDSLPVRAELEKKEIDLQKQTKTLEKYLVNTTIDVGDKFIMK
jgi:hypothetical protein